MALTDLKTITMRHEETANFTVKLLMLEGVGFQVAWRHKPSRGTASGAAVREPPTPTRDLAEAETLYEARLRRICMSEAQVALGLLPERRNRYITTSLQIHTE
jgi:hypothetical protein